MSEPIPGLNLSRSVHYVLPEDPLYPKVIALRHRAAIVTEIVDPVVGLVGLTVFMQKTDELSGCTSALQQLYCKFSKVPQDDTWHYVEYVP
jgi:hypothetical protein